MSASVAQDRSGSPRWIVGILAAAVAAALLSAAAIASSNHIDHPAAIVHPGADGPSAPAIEADFLDHPLPDGLGHDGQQFYAIARQPMHLDQVAPHLDRPRYRLQRIAQPLLVWALHPQGGGDGLITATVVVGVLSLGALAIAIGALSVQVGGSPLLALLPLALHGAFMAMRLSTADNLALAAALGAMALSLSGRHRLAVASGVLAVLAKESSWLMLLGLALWRRDRRGVELAAVPAAVGAAWWVALRFLVDDHSAGVTEFSLPFLGLWRSVQWWMDGRTVFAHYVVPAALVLGLWALVRVGLRHPLGPAIAIQLAFLPLLNRDVLALDANGSRMTMPLTVLAAVALLAHLRTGRSPAATSAAAQSGPTSHDLA